MYIALSKNSNREQFLPELSHKGGNKIEIKYIAGFCIIAFVSSAIFRSKQIILRTLFSYLTHRPI